MAPHHSLAPLADTAPTLLPPLLVPLALAEFFWNFTNPTATNYFVSSIVASMQGPDVDGTFADDVTGLPAEHGAAPGNMRLSAADVAALQMATSVASQALIDAAIAAGKYVWQAFGDQDGVSAGPSAANCAAWMHQRCSADWQARATTQLYDPAHANASLASFLIVRPCVTRRAQPAA